MNMIKPSLVVAALSLLSPVLVSAQSLTPLQQSVQNVMGMDHRTEAELARDADRDPMAALDFIGLEDDMTVIEFLPAGQAYYTKILGPVLRDKGHLYSVDNANTFGNWGDWTKADMFAMTHQVTIRTDRKSVV